MFGFLSFSQSQLMHGFPWDIATHCPRPWSGERLPERQELEHRQVQIATGHGAGA